MTEAGEITLPRIVLGPRYADRNYGVVGITRSCVLRDEERSTLLLLLNAARFLGANPAPCAVSLPLGRDGTNWAVGWIRAAGANRIFLDVVLISKADFIRTGWATHALLMVPWDEPLPQGEGVDLEPRSFRLDAAPGQARVSSGALTELASALIAGNGHSIAVVPPTNPAEALVTAWSGLHPSERRGTSFATSQKLQELAATEGLPRFDLIVASQGEFSAPAAIAAQTFDPSEIGLGDKDTLVLDILARESELSAFNSRARLPRPGPAGSKPLYVRWILRSTFDAHLKDDPAHERGAYRRLFRAVVNTIHAKRHDRSIPSSEIDAYQSGLLLAFEDVMPATPQMAADFISYYVAELEPLLENAPPALPARLVAKTGAFWHLEPAARQRVLAIVLGDSYFANELAQRLDQPAEGEAVLATAHAVANAMDDSQSEGLTTLAARLFQLAAGLRGTGVEAARTLAARLSVLRDYGLLNRLLKGARYERDLCLQVAGVTRWPQVREESRDVSEYFAHRALRLRLRRAFHGGAL